MSSAGEIDSSRYMNDDTPKCSSQNARATSYSARSRVSNPRANVRFAPDLTRSFTVPETDADARTFFAADPGTAQFGWNGQIYAPAAETFRHSRNFMARYMYMSARSAADNILSYSHCSDHHPF